MIRIHKDYNGFSDNFSDFLAKIPENIVIDIIDKNERKLPFLDLTETPFETNPIVRFKDTYVIGYNTEVITECGLTRSECYACILHEIGHLINQSTKENGCELEILCDKVATNANMQIALISALKKMQNAFEIDLSIRINTLYSYMKYYYRPIWTAGRYNDKAQVAIYYNLIAGVSYYFESFSAMVIGEILSHPRNGEFILEELATKLNIAMESLAPFFQQLEEMGIVSSVFPSEDVIADYRSRVSAYNRQQGHSPVERTTQEKLPYAISNAEMMYTEKVGGITSVMFELTYNCSEKCIHCYNEGATRNDEEKNGRGNREEMTLEDYKRVIDDLYEQGLIKICLTGGDPFSKPFAWELIDYIYNKGIVFDIFTNGQHITHDVKRLADYYPRSIGISVYSGLPDVHDFITRIPGSWTRSMNVVKELSELAVPMNLKCCVMRPNVKSYYMVADIAKQHGAVPQFEISLTDSIEGDTCVSKYLRMTPEQLEIVLRDDNVPLYVGKEAPNFGGQPKRMDNNPCGAGYNSFCITPEGNVIPCCSFHTLFGNLKEQGITEIDTNNENLKYWRNLTLNDYEECGQYDYCDYCNLCPGNNFMEHGTPLKASENNCYIAKARYGLAQKMKKGYDPLNGKSLKERLAELPDYVPTKIKREMSQNFSDTRLTVGG